MFDGIFSTGFSFIRSRVQAQSYEDAQTLLALDDAAAGAACYLPSDPARVTRAAATYGPGSRLHHTTPDLGLSSATQSDNGIDVDDLPPQVRPRSLRLVFL